MRITEINPAKSGLSCRDARNLFDGHLDGELSAALEMELNVHRVNCAACRHELALLEVAGDVIATDSPEATLDENFTDRLLACVASKPLPRTETIRPRRARIIRWGLRGLAAAAAIALVVAYWPADQIAGFSAAGPSSRTPKPRAVSPAQVRSPEGDFQAQLERALTGWRRDASSLRKAYEFITPQLIEEMGLDSSEGVHDQHNSIEPAEDDLEIEDI